MPLGGRGPGLGDRRPPLQRQLALRRSRRRATARSRRCSRRTSTGEDAPPRRSTPPRASDMADTAGRSPSQRRHATFATGVLAVERRPATRAPSLSPCPLDDVDNAVDRLITVEVDRHRRRSSASLALVAWWVIRLGVRPIKQMTATATPIAGGDLSHRVPDGDRRHRGRRRSASRSTRCSDASRSAFDERTRVGAAAAPVRRRRVPRAAHAGDDDPRATPSCTGSAASPTASELAEAMRRTEQEAIRMGRLVDDLLHLARLDEGRPLERGPSTSPRSSPTPSGDARAVDTGARRSRARTGRSARRDRRRGPAPPGDRQPRRQRPRAHAARRRRSRPRRRSRRSRRGRGRATDGPGMAAEVAARAFERFYRADPSPVPSPRRQRARAGDRRTPRSAPTGARWAYAVPSARARPYGWSSQSRADVC